MYQKKLKTQEDKKKKMAEEEKKKKKKSKLNWKNLQYIVVRHCTCAYFFWINIEDLGGIGAGHSYKSTGIHFSRGNPFLPDDRHPVFHTIYAVRNLPEIIFPQSFLIRIEGAVVSTSALQIIAGN